MTRTRTASLLLLVACLRDPGPGPDLGQCADYPDGTYTFGDAGIGTCLAGPTDVRFDVRDGRTWMLVVNADPFRNFGTGSVLWLDATTLPAASGTVLTHELTGHALEVPEFAAEAALARSGDLAVIPARRSEGYVSGSPDQLLLLDLSEVTRPAFHERRFLQSGADPYAVEVDPTSGRVFVANATGTSITVVDTIAEPPKLVDPAPQSLLSSPVYVPSPAGDGVAELTGEILTNLEITRTDAWTATWLPGTSRIWVPTGTGLARWSSGDGSWYPAAFGTELDAADTLELTEIADPWLATAFDELFMVYGDDGVLRTAFTNGHAGDWSYDTGSLLDQGLPGRAFATAPTLVSVRGSSRMYFEARDGRAGDPVVGVATTLDGLTWTADDTAALTPPEGFTGVGQPSALPDPILGAVRMWVTLDDGSRTSIGVARSSDDGFTFDAPVEVLTRSGGDIGAPVVTWVGGRYLMWLTLRDGDGPWQHATSWSWDGLDWSEPRVFLTSDQDGDRPPRLALQPSATLAWRLEGSNAGVLDDQIEAGTEWSSTSRGFELRVAHGQVAGTTTGANMEGGLLPGAVASPGGVETLYATATDADGLDRLVALRQLGTRWVVTADDLVPEGSGGNVDGVRSPVVFQRGGLWVMLYGAVDGDVTSLRAATSVDGLVWMAEDGPALDGDRLGWEGVEQAPHSVVEDEDGSLVLWYAGTDGSRWRIGNATSDDGLSWTPRLGANDPWVFAAGEPGAFDDSGVRDPMVVVDGDREIMWYAGFDGDRWSIGIATRALGSTAWTRRVPPVAPTSESVLPPIGSTFSDSETRSPAVIPEGDAWRVYYGGHDSFVWRVGEGWSDGADAFPRHRVPGDGARFEFTTRRGQFGRSVIDLAQVVERVPLPGATQTSGTGPSALLVDPARGFLYAAYQGFPGVVVVDIRDDSTADFEDLNFLDIEAVIRFASTTGDVGVYRMALAPDGRVWATTNDPDAVVLFDPTSIPDDADKEIVDDLVVGALPMHDVSDDDGEETFARVGAAGLALVPDQDLLIATHFRDNSVSIFDLTLGEVGEEIAHLEDVGENPHLVRVSPDGLWAVVVSYLGRVTDDVSGPSLSILDLRPGSPTYLQIRARVVNR